MKNLPHILYFAIALASCVTTTNAMAIGKGFYIHMASGNADWTAEDDNNFKRDYDSNTSHFGIGFVLDTATEIDRVFNYRFQVGYEQFNSDSTSKLADFDMASVVTDHDFGFGIVRNDAIRFWLGPEVRASFSFDSKDNFDMALFGLGVGPAIGINFHTAGNVSLGLKGGYMKMSYFGGGDDTSALDNNIEYNVDEDFFFFNFAVLFR